MYLVARIYLCSVKVYRRIDAGRAGTYIKNPPGPSGTFPYARGLYPTHPVRAIRYTYNVKLRVPHGIAGCAGPH